MATTDETMAAGLSHEEIEATMSTIKKMIVAGALFVVVGYALLGIAGIETAFYIWGWEDATKMWFKLGGVGHILIGIFISLVAIIRTLSLVPDRLSERLE